MNTSLPETELRWWMRHLGRYFSNLQDIGEGFTAESMSAQLPGIKC
jgi:hypothetical protein